MLKTRITRDGMARVVAFLPDLEAPGFVPSWYHSGELLPNGSWSVGFYEYAPRVCALLGTLDRYGFVEPFDWPAWHTEAQRYYSNPREIETANLSVLQKLVTIHLRKERFCEGHLDTVLRSGHMVAILRRLRVLLDEMPPTVRLQLHVGDLTKLAVDAVVNAANDRLAGGGGVDGAIHRAAGPQLLVACRALGGCKTGQACLTPGFLLPSRYVIHAVGPVWQGGSFHEEELLASAYRNSLELAGQQGLATVAFSALSCGVYGFPIPKACEIAVRRLEQTAPNSPSVKQIILVAFNAEVARAYQNLGVQS